MSVGLVDIYLLQLKSLIFALTSRAGTINAIQSVKGDITEDLDEGVFALCREGL